MHALKRPYHSLKWFQLVFIVLFLVTSNAKLSAQVSDSVKPASIEPKKVNTPGSHSPKKAALMSAIVPGSGQIYNKKYWKAPVIYAGAIGIGYAFNFNQKKYVEYRNAYKVRLSNGPGTLGNHPRYSDGDLLTLQKYYHRYRDLSVIGGVLLYFMNIIDATVDAHLFDFSVEDDDLSFNVQPALINTAYSGQYASPYTTGLSLRINF